ncbi:hypothetical protein D9599_15310 [Roseomonas sp. KE2513]|uniref:DUF6876 family protein n=1 Tax=Roseomonas sp. KE2513 TaxID=2479202 RepID=UPI0018DFE29C|nr:DUF6876 family protein [Roseomonas sp. KE2513]MBI0536937.1 hypothetical protein [Roseomonas sp. KE2513]
MSASIDTLSRYAPAIPQGSDDEHRVEWLGIGLQIAFAERLRQDLAGYRDAEPAGRHNYAGVTLRLTKGVMHLANEAGCFWLLDQVCTAQADPAVRRLPVQIWTLGVSRDRSAALACGDGRGRVLHDRAVAWTDFPLTAVALRVEAKLIALRSER